MEIKYEAVKDPMDPDGIRNLAGLFDILLKMDRRDKERKTRLKKEPEGFPLESDGYPCSVCRNTMKVEDSWYDWYGQICLLCRRAIKENIVPTFVCKYSNSHFKTWELKESFGIHQQTAKKMVRLGELKARIVLNNQGKPYEYIFLKKENPQLVDPERDTPELKSWKRNRDKVLDERIRKETKKSCVEMEKLITKLKK